MFNIVKLTFVPNLFHHPLTAIVIQVVFFMTQILHVGLELEILMVDCTQVVSSKQ